MFVCLCVCVQELYREYTDLTQRHKAEMNARHKQQQTDVDSLHNITAHPDTAADDISRERLSRMVWFILL